MDYSFILHDSIPQYDELIKYGFIKNDGNYSISRKISSEFYVDIVICEKTITAEVFENDTNEKYVLFDVLSAQGAFVGSIRTEVQKLFGEIRHKCFVSEDLTEKYIKWIENTYSITGEFPWDGDESAEVFRCPNGKWLGLIMEIPFTKLGIKSEELVHVVNLKYDAEKIPEIIDNKSIFPAWHMNKKYWVTVLLTNITDFTKLCDITKRSYELVMKIKH